MAEDGYAETPKEEPKKLLTLVTLISAFGSSFQYGYNLSVINFPAQVLQDFYNQTYYRRNRISMDQNILVFLWSLTILFFPLGGLMGSLLMGPVVDTWGRKTTLLANSILAIVSVVFTGSSKAIHSYEFVIFSRLIIGICAGLAFSVVPMYLSEVSPKKLRGGIIVVAQLYITFGILVAQIFSLHDILGTRDGWPTLLSIVGFPAVFQLFILPYLPESPRYLLIQKRDEEKARKVLIKLRGQEDVEAELEDMRQEDLFEKAEKELDARKLFSFPRLRWQLLSVIVMMMGQQLAGITAVSHYTGRIYLAAGIKEKDECYVTVIVSTSLAFVIMVSMCTIDYLGRRILLLTGFGICSISSILLAISLELKATVSWMSYFNMAFIIIYLLGHSLGPSPLLCVMVAELFLQSSRSAAFVVAGSVHWLGNCLTELAFLHVDLGMGSYAFVVFWPVSTITFVYILMVIPETKNKTFLEIRKLMDARMAKKLDKGQEGKAQQGSVGL